MKKLFFIFILLFLWLFAYPVLADYTVQFPLPNMDSTTIRDDPAVYIRYFFIFGLILAGFLAVAALVFGGILYMTSGTVGKVDRAKTIMGGALTGLVLLLCSYLLLYTIDPSLVILSPVSLTPVTAPATNNQQQVNIANYCSPPCNSATQVCQPPMGCVAKPAGTTDECTVHSPATCTMVKCANGGICYCGTWDKDTCQCDYSVSTCP